MEHIWQYIIPIFCLGIAISIYRVQARRKRDYKEIIEPILYRFDYEFISSTTPKWFDVGPFPKIELR